MSLLTLVEKKAPQRMKDQSQSNRNVEISSDGSILFVDGKIVFFC